MEIYHGNLKLYTYVFVTILLYWLAHVHVYSYTLQKYPVIPVSHCWTNQSQVYIGFKGGQLMMIDVDSSSMKILINQSQVHNAALQNEIKIFMIVTVQEVTSTSTVLEDEDTPKTAHALLCEGSVDCLTLSHRGLITAGKVNV